MPIVASFQNLSNRRQLALAGGLLVMLCALLVGAYLLFLKPNYGTLFSQLRPADAAAIVTELDKRKIPYRIEDGGATILVPQHEVDAVRLEVMSDDLPIKGMVGFELFNKSDMGLTEFAQKINYQRALQGELARTIMTIEGVEAARVHLSLSEQTIFKADRIPPKASVTLTTRPGAVLAGGAVRGIQQLIAASIPELGVSNVVVLNDEGQVVSSEPASEPEVSSPLQQQKSAIEAFELARIRDRLASSYRPDSLTVAVWADISTLSSSTEFSPDPSLPGSAARDYRLVVTLTPHVTLSDAARGDILARTAEAVDFKPGLGDVISFAAYAPKPNGQDYAPAPHRASPAPLGANDAITRSEDWGLVGFTVFFAAVCLALLGIGLSVARNRRRQAFVKRFRAIFDQDEEARVETA